MRKATVKSAVAAILAGTMLVGSAVVSAGAATAGETTSADKVVINYSTQKQSTYLDFDSSKTIGSGTVTAEVGDLIEVTVSAMSNDPDYDKFCNGQCVTVFNTNSTDGNLISENNGILSYYNEYYTDEDDEYITVSYNDKVPSATFNTYQGHVLFFNFSNQNNILDLSKKTKLYSFVVKADKAGTVNIVTGDYFLGVGDINDAFLYVEGKADLYTDVKVIKDEPEPPTPGDYLVGDVNGDGKVNGIDAATLSRYTSSWDGYESRIKNMKAADINGDGKVNGSDAGILARYTSGWDSENYKKYFK